LGEAKARVHAFPLAQFIFHEVGSFDAIVDIVGACRKASTLLGIEKLPVRFEWWAAELVENGPSGVCGPVPSPATAQFVERKRRTQPGAKRLVTPHRRCDFATLCDSFGPPPPMSVTRPHRVLRQATADL